MNNNMQPQQSDDSHWTYGPISPPSSSPAVENSQSYPSPDAQKLVLSGNGSLYNDHTLALPPQVQQVPPTNYSYIPAGSTVPASPPTPTVYAFPPAPGSTMAAPFRANPRMWTGHKSSLSQVIWWFAFVAVVIAIVAVVVLFLPSVLALQNPQGVVAIPTTTVQPTPTMVPPTPIPISQTLNGITFTPSQFLLTTDCQLDNGYRCALTLQASAALQARTLWSATAQPRASLQFHPGRGTLQPGQPVQLVINVKGTCPYQGSLLFTVKRQHLTVLLYC